MLLVLTTCNTLFFYHGLLFPSFLLALSLSLQLVTVNMHVMILCRLHACTTHILSMFAAVGTAAESQDVVLNCFFFTISRSLPIRTYIGQKLVNNNDK